MKVLDDCDQLPFGPHSDAVWWEESVEDFERQWRWKLEVLQCEADVGGALTNHADVRCCEEELEHTRASVLAVDEAQRQRILVQLRARVRRLGTGKRRDLTETCVVAGKRSSSIGSQRS
jgi:galactitol-specific phosphotransferase system IIB component